MHLDKSRRTDRQHNPIDVTILTLGPMSKCSLFLRYRKIPFVNPAKKNIKFIKKLLSSILNFAIQIQNSCLHWNLCIDWFIKLPQIKKNSNIIWQHFHLFNSVIAKTKKYKLAGSYFYWPICIYEKMHFEIINENGLTNEK